MSSETEISDELKRFVEEILATNGFPLTSKIEYGVGSEVGDGYTSKTFTVDITTDGKSLHLFLKTPLGLSWHENLPMHKLFQNESYFYSTLYPAYQAFLKEKRITDGFQNVPKCYAVRGDFLALENLKRKGYRLFAKGKTMNDDHILLAMRSFAKFHAISFALKDQRKDLYETLKQNLQPSMGDLSATAGFHKMIVLAIQEFLKTLDPVDDKELSDAGDNAVATMTDILLTVDQHANEYSIITQGDSWCYNIMFLYDQTNLDTPIDIMQVDWQLPRHGSPAIDLCYFFYPISSEATIEKYEYYMKEYHEELSKRIRQLGSDPETLYPLLVLKEEWKKFAKFGFAMGFFLVKSILMSKDEMPNLEEYPELYDQIVNQGKDPKSLWAVIVPLCIDTNPVQPAKDVPPQTMVELPSRFGIDLMLRWE
ncbi:hypothetical protein Trydic_g11576 [Trypoxylus dichotomus]